MEGSVLECENKEIVMVRTNDPSDTHQPYKLTKGRWRERRTLRVQPYDPSRILQILRVRQELSPVREPLPIELEQITKVGVLSSVGDEVLPVLPRRVGGGEECQALLLLGKRGHGGRLT